MHVAVLITAGAETGPGGNGGSDVDPFLANVAEIGVAETTLYSPEGG